MNEKKDFFELLRELHSWQIFVIALIIIVVYFMIKTELINKLFSSEKQKRESDKKLEEEIKRIKNEFAEKAFKNIEQAAHHAVESLEHCIGANYYVIHDSGGDLRDTDKWYLAVLRSTSFAVGTDYAQPIIVNNGFRWFNENIRDRMFYYVSNAEKEKNLEGIDGDYCKTMGIKSFAGALVKNEGHVYHIVSLNFDIIEPKKVNPDIRKIIFEFKRSVLTNI